MFDSTLEEGVVSASQCPRHGHETAVRRKLTHPLPEDVYAVRTRFTEHALKQAQRRAIAHEILALVLHHHNRSQKLAGRARAIWISRRGRKVLARTGIPPGIVERAAGVRLIVCMRTDEVITCEHATVRRRWC